MANTKIQWATKVWNPVTGCDKISEGCLNCYSEPFAKRLQKNPKRNIAYKYRNAFKPTCHPESLFEPYLWKKPQRVFVCSMGDLFHDDIPFDFIRKVMDNIYHNRAHTFMILTKRPQRMKQFFDWLNNPNLAINFSNLWLGVTAENQQRADERITILLQIPAAIRFVSIEPMLGAIDIEKYLDEGGDICPREIIDWVICGGETGHNARPIHPDWVRSIREQCKDAKVRFFFKQWGDWDGIKMYKVGKKPAGNLLDGIEYSQLPNIKYCHYNQSCLHQTKDMKCTLAVGCNFQD